MKIRMEGNSVRLRLRRSEVDEISAGREVSESVGFPQGEWAYSLIPDPGVKTLKARLASGRISVFLPVEQAYQWAASDRVGFEHHQELPGGEKLHLLVEKDFVCLDRDLAGQEDQFPNPKSETREC